jgi:hypothetical protein
MARLTFLVALLTAASFAAARADDAYVTGADYLAMPLVERTAYIMAASDMQVRMLRELDEGSDAAAFIERVKRCTKDMTSTQLREFIDEYMGRDAVYKTYTMVSNFRAALHAKCPT